MWATLATARTSESDRHPLGAAPKLTQSVELVVEELTLVEAGAGVVGGIGSRSSVGRGGGRRAGETTGGHCFC